MIYRLVFILFIFLAKSWPATVSGYIKDNETEKAIPNANIIIKETGQGIPSNPYGHFELNLPNGTLLWKLLLLAL